MILVNLIFNFSFCTRFKDNSSLVERCVYEDVRTARIRISVNDEIDQCDGKRFKTSRKSNSISLLQRRRRSTSVILSEYLNEFFLENISY